MEGVRFINCVSEEEFLSLFGNVVEYTPKVAIQMFKQKPFSSTKNVMDSLDSAIDSLTSEEKLEVLSGHPDLAGRLADSDLLTPESTREQKEAGLHLLTMEDKLKLKSHNDKYRQQFGFTFIICARENKAAAILNGLNTRLTNTKEEEIGIGIGEVKKIAKLRALDILDKYACKSKL